ncbi:MAG TPA: YqgE/AlgH family protein [Thermoanaerobaculia bacterium]|jgi:putative transcriptional regulator
MTVAGSDLSTPVLLLAMPQVLDPSFHRSVVLLLHHEDAGSFGFVVNRPTDIKIREILKGMDIGWRGNEKAVAYMGGPVQQNLGTVLFTPVLPDGDTDDTATEIAPGIALTQHIGDLSRLAEAPPDHFRLLLGYAGWSEGQLMEEILRNDWLTAPVSDELIFAPDPEQVWDAALRSVGINPAALPSWVPGNSSGESAN